MQVSSTSAQATTRDGSREPTAPRSESLQQRHARDSFERALQARHQRHEAGHDDGEESGAADGAPAASWSAVVPTQPPPLRAAAGAPAPAPAGGPAEHSGTRAAIEASLSASPGEVVTPLASADPAALWEVSLSEPGGVPLALRAERTGAADAPRAWGLTLTSQAAHADALARQVPRLSERLRKQAIDLDHVRIEHDGNDEP